MTQALRRRYAGNRYGVKRLLVVLILTVTGLAIFLAIYDGVREADGLSTLDTAVFKWVVNHRDPLTTMFMQTVTNLASPQSILIIIIGASIMWIRKTREVWRPFLLIAAVALSVSLSTVLKLATSRLRPPRSEMISPVMFDYSFPSGHALVIAVAMLVAGYLIFSRQPNSRLLIAWAIASVIGIVLVAYSRLYLGYHWLTDVSASTGVALIVLALVILADPLRPRWMTFTPKASSDTDR